MPKKIHHASQNYPLSIRKFFRVPGFVVDKRYEQLAHHNFFFSKDPKKSHHELFHEKRLPEDPTIFHVSPSRMDPSQAPARCENLKILPHVPYVQEKPFSRIEYAEFREKVLDKLEPMALTDVRKHIITEDEWTPEDIQKRYYSNRGAIYGIVSDKRKTKVSKHPRNARNSKTSFLSGAV